MSPASDALRRWRERPDTFVREQFRVEPDAWQIEALQAFPHHQRLAFKACKGPGKTALLAWLVWNFLATRPQAKVAATSITGDNLADNLWSELAKWQSKSPFLSAQFEWARTRIVHRQQPENWWASARTWPRTGNPQQQADTLAGLHADFMLFVLDETGSMPDAVMAAAEASLASGKESHIVQAGNPTMLSGPLYRACSLERDLWHVVEITGDPDDPKRSSRVSEQWARDQIQKYGRENPWVLVNVFGRFPPHSINALIGPDEVRDAMKRHYRAESFVNSPIILGVDVAREGDDASVIYRRQSPVLWPPLVLRNVDSLVGAAQVQMQWTQHAADACLIDATGGFGSGWIDQLRVFGRSPIGVHFSAEPNDRRYANKRAEMYYLAVEWIREGGALPEEPELLRDLCATNYTFAKDRILLQPKDQIKATLGHSPDHGDGFALTFAQPVVKARPGAQAALAARAMMGDYDPHEAYRHAR
jgi:phage terminase large subunit